MTKIDYEVRYNHLLELLESISPILTSSTMPYQERQNRIKIFEEGLKAHFKSERKEEELYGGD